MKTITPAVITLGEALVEIMRPDSADPLDRPGIFMGPFPSGAPAIFAAAAARLGLDTGLISCTGNDAFGRMLTKRFESESVDIGQHQTSVGRSTGAAFVAYSGDGEREFVFHIRDSAAGDISPERIAESYFQNIRWLHVSGSTLMLTAAWQDAVDRAIRLTRQAGGKVSIDPNLRPNLLSNEHAARLLAPYLAEADLVFPTASELAELAPGAGDEAAALRSISKPGAVAIVKRGAAGCSLFDDSGRLDIPGFRVTEVDPTGAGDVFAAAFIAGIESGFPPEKAARFANAAGAIAVTRRGPMEGLADRDAVEKMIQNAEKV